MTVIPTLLKWVERKRPISTPRYRWASNPNWSQSAPVERGESRDAVSTTQGIADWRSGPRIERLKTVAKSHLDRLRVHSQASQAGGRDFADKSLRQGYARLGWTVEVTMEDCHHGEYSILMEWVCDCPAVEPRK
jgi:hypothetical protein